MQTNLPAGYDAWLTTDRAYEARAAAAEAFEAWAETEMPDLDWDDDDAVAAAEADFEADFEAEMEDRWEARAIDAAEARAEARWEREMDRY